MPNVPVVDALIFNGSLSQQVTVKAQGIAGNVTLLLPNIAPSVGSVLVASSINGSNVTLGWTGLAINPAPQASPTFTGTVTLPADVQNTTGSDLTVNSGANAVILSNNFGTLNFGGALAGPRFALQTENAAFTIDSTGNMAITTSDINATQTVSSYGTASFESTHANVAILANTGIAITSTTSGISLNPAAGANTSITNANLLGTVKDNGNSAGTSGQVLQSTSAAAVWANLLMAADGSAPALANTHTVSGTATLSSGTVTITLTGNAVFSANTAYAVQLTYLGAPTGTGKLYVTRTSGSVFVINSTVGSDADQVSWTAIGF